MYSFFSNVAHHFEQFLLFVLFHLKCMSKKICFSIICIMVNPLPSIVLTKLLTEVLTLYEYVLHVIEVSHSDFGALGLQISVSTDEESRSPVLFWGSGVFVGFFNCHVSTEKHFLCKAAEYPVDVPNCVWSHLNLFPIKVIIFVGKFIFLSICLN